MSKMSFFHYIINQERNNFYKTLVNIVTDASNPRQKILNLTHFILCNAKHV